MTCASELNVSIHMYLVHIMDGLFQDVIPPGVMGDN